MPDHSIPLMEDVQDAGHVLGPDEIGALIAEQMRLEADAERIALEYRIKTTQCRIKAARLLLQMVEQHGYKNTRYVEFAQKHGVLTRTDAYDMLVLCEADDDVPTSEDHSTWRQIVHNIKQRGKEREDMFWITPPELAAEIRAESAGGEYYDPCPCPLPENHDALEIDWNAQPLDVWLNGPFVRRHEKNGRGLTAYARKAIREAQQGTTVRMVVPVRRIITLLLEAGAEVRSLGRVRWLHALTGKPMTGPVPCLLFVLRGKPRAANDNQPTGRSGHAGSRC